jgi:formylmethanofuran dehydrogenase subunit B
LTSTGSSAPATCLGCGCACDDINLRVADNQIVEARNACALGAAWFGDGTVPSRVRVAGREATVDMALEAAARLLTAATRPIVYLAPDISCETQRAGIALADLLRAMVDTVSSSTVMASILAAQEIGRASATLGEIRNRADVLVFWGVDPAVRYPRYWTRYAPDPAGLHVNGRRSRTVVAVDIGPWRGPEDADLRVAVAPTDEVAVLTLLRAAVSSSRAPAHPSVAPLFTALSHGRYVAVVADAEPDESSGGRDPGRAAALIAAAQALNGIARCGLSTLRAGGNRSGADACLTSQTGYPAAVDFSRGFPRYRPHDAIDSRLGDGQADALLIIGSVGLIPDKTLTLIGNMPCAVIGPRASDAPLAHAAATIDTAVAGIHEAGTALRMDDVPLPLRAMVTGPPSTLTIVDALGSRIGVPTRGH